jgi:cyclic-di-GMP-binding protein
LAAMEPVRRHPAMLAPAGTYASRRFVFVRETDHVYVAQARALGLDMQTASVELFQYEIDPYPI